MFDDVVEEAAMHRRPTDCNGSGDPARANAPSSPMGLSLRSSVLRAARCGELARAVVPAGPI